jgi:hypothetical protein
MIEKWAEILGEHVGKTIQYVRYWPQYEDGSGWQYLVVDFTDGTSVRLSPIAFCEATK